MIGNHGISNIAYALQTMRDLQGGKLVLMAGEGDTVVMLGSQNGGFFVRVADLETWTGDKLYDALKEYRSWLTEEKTIYIQRLLELGTRIFFVGDDGRCRKIYYDGKNFVVEWGLLHFHSKAEFGFYLDAADKFSGLLNLE